MKNFLKDESGAIITAEIVLVATILLIGAVAGLKSVRDAVVTELADVAQAFANLNQSYFYSPTTGHSAFTGGSAFYDLKDYCDDDTVVHQKHEKRRISCCNTNDYLYQESKCVSVVDPRFFYHEEMPKTRVCNVGNY